MPHKSYSNTQKSDSADQETVNRELRAIKTDLAQLTDVLNTLVALQQKYYSTLGEIISFSNKRAASLERLAASMEKLAASMERLAASLEKLAEVVQEQSKETIKALKKIQEGFFSSSGNTPSALQQINDNHNDDKLELI
ncbi:hypothetical protein HYPBUDRAFT_150657 [Hyphopichia burtonii NRRL Y-1933]|uniref:Uncharacterized protein n=1 Tax=Hyphopichia burtonii NRRL Y-1933 TaxID=984485 RepID=A0A1E4RDG2_9ASCO|nr:hypothetical protein HYPBUDRAFT_150657 [Hyphopichia burtonii NRRL Y-1933]ODV65291.1 hypothetical protein HYPBUDRAFT_150657 [Hyphopichia burtonii NRRL Y-1933]